ncbi:type II toxin-antitoxin system Phd/YefM family antitoxin [Plastoroseomonas arctica]|uniref:Antitoxin n=1 Tax=Plastoroseomonas arctica TaxID=1509237 RepID=A0AAF1KLI8_9PROT|nr:type II toxin-antitoxin system prevent-host-death family antitoxin [Plastoroseomonas arctica]MBR0654761.1 type II toxin-antitoxin system prevent-host-death family antitoxin [Plastoroseomonas arctica]
MDTNIGAYAAKTHLGQLLDRVEAGETLTITRNGKAVAKLVPANPPVASGTAIVESLRAFHEQLRADGAKPFTTEEILDLVKSGRKY